MNIFKRLKRDLDRFFQSYESRPAGRRLARLKALRISRQELFVAKIEEISDGEFLITVAYIENGAPKILRVYSRRHFEARSKVKLRHQPVPWLVMQTFLGQNYAAQPESYLIAIPG